MQDKSSHYFKYSKVTNFTLLTLQLRHSSFYNANRSSKISLSLLFSSPKGLNYIFKRQLRLP